MKGRAWKTWHVKHRPIPLRQIFARAWRKHGKRFADNITKDNVMLNRLLGR